MRENRPYGSEGGEQRYCSPTPISLCAHGAPLFAWIPAYAGTTTYFRPATFKSAGFSMMRYPPSSLRRRPESVRPRGHHISAVQVRVEASHDLVVEGNCVAVRRGGE